MKKATLYIILLGGILFHSCKNEINQFLPGGGGSSKSWFEPIPYGMAYIPRGSYLMGPSDDEVKIFNTSSRRVSIESFWMDDTEITNNEYRQFVYWVRDSIARTLLAQVYLSLCTPKLRKEFHSPSQSSTGAKKLTGEMKTICRQSMTCSCRNMSVLPLPGD